jgi:hypothetical protein
VVRLRRVFWSSLIAPLEGIVDADHLCLTTPPWSALERARRGGWYLAEPADSVAVAGCD